MNPKVSSKVTAKTMNMKQRVELLKERREEVAAGGGERRLEKQRAEGKLTARERIAELVDPDSFQESGMFAQHRATLFGMADSTLPADGVVTGWGDVDGRPVAIVAYDFTVMAGSMGQTGEIKVTLIRETRCVEYAR